MNKEHLWHKVDMKVHFLYSNRRLIYLWVAGILTFALCAIDSSSIIFNRFTLCMKSFMVLFAYMLWVPVNLTGISSSAGGRPKQAQ